MPAELELTLRDLLLYAAIPGAGGGLAAFLLSIRLGRIHGKLVKKAILEVVGGMLLAVFVGWWLAVSVISSYSGRVVITFAIGVGWSQVVGVIRVWATNKVRDVLSEEEAE